MRGIRIETILILISFKVSECVDKLGGICAERAALYMVHNDVPAPLRPIFIQTFVFVHSI